MHLLAGAAVVVVVVAAVVVVVVVAAVVVVVVAAVVAVVVVVVVGSAVVVVVVAAVVAAVVVVVGAAVVVVVVVAVHIAVKVMFDVGVYEAPAETIIGSPPDGGFLQKLNVNPDLVGVGAVTDTPALTVFDVGETVPPFASQVTVYCIVVHWANNVAPAFTV